MFNQPEFSTDTWITQFRQMSKLEEQLKFILLILKSVDAELQSKFHSEIILFEKYFLDKSFMREVKHRDSVIQTNSTEYYGKDFGEQDVFKFNEELENKITKISLKIMDTLGRIIKKINESEFNLGKET